MSFGTRDSKPIFRDVLLLWKYEPPPWPPAIGRVSARQWLHPWGMPACPSSTSSRLIYSQINFLVFFAPFLILVVGSGTCGLPVNETEGPSPLDILRVCPASSSLQSAVPCFGVRVFLWVYHQPNPNPLPVGRNQAAPNRGL